MLPVRQIHDQRREHVSRLNATRHQGFLDLGPAVVLAVLEFEPRPANGEGAVAPGLGDTRDRKREIAGYGQATDHQGRALGIPIRPLSAGNHTQGQGGRHQPLHYLSAVEGVLIHEV